MEQEKKVNKVRKIPGIKGMNDVLPDEMYLWEFVQDSVREVLSNYGYQRMRTPIVEETSLFARGLGEVTDIVEKEMYSFEDALNGDKLTLRPEGTAGTVRAIIEHNLTYNGARRLWYSGPMFRHERPQRGRYRQFHQIGVEAVGFNGPDIDVEVILLCARLWKKLELKNVRLEINSIGDAIERNRHRADLISYFEKHQEILDEDAKRRLYSNPLRILDTKNPLMQDMVNDAPKLLDYLGEESLAHFNAVKHLLQSNGISFTVNPRLVRGMDYYNRTVFEWISDELGSQGTICGGGRYDTLFEMFGAKHTPACGFAMGVERLIELLKVQRTDLQALPSADIYIVHKGEGAAAIAYIVGEQLRDTGFNVVMYCTEVNSGGSFKSQMKRADDSGAEFAIVIGEDEVLQNAVQVKALRDEKAENAQIIIALDEAVDYIVDQMCSKYDCGCGGGGECGCGSHHEH